MRDVAYPTAHRCPALMLSRTSTKLLQRLRTPVTANGFGASPSALVAPGLSPPAQPPSPVLTRS